MRHMTCSVSHHIQLPFSISSVPSPELIPGLTERHITPRVFQTSSLHPSVSPFSSNNSKPLERSSTATLEPIHTKMSHNKGGSPNMSLGRDDDYTALAPPPSYIEATTSGPRSDPMSPEHPSPRPGQNPLRHIIRSLPSQVRGARQDQLSHKMDDEQLLAEGLTPYLAEFLHSLPASVLYPHKRQNHQRPVSAELILLPAGAVPATQGWTLSDLDQRREDAAHVRIVEVPPPGKEEKLGLCPSDQKQPYAPPDALGGDRRDLSWWRDEDLAGRLASTIRCYLEPEEEAPGPGSHTGADRGDNGLYRAQEGDFARHGRSKSTDKSVHSSNGHKALGSQSRSGNHHTWEGENGVGVARAGVQAEEVTFRRENDMGLWESSSGWVIVMTMTVAT